MKTIYCSGTRLLMLGLVLGGHGILTTPSLAGGHNQVYVPVAAQGGYAAPVSYAPVAGWATYAAPMPTMYAPVPAGYYQQAPTPNYLVPQTYQAPAAVTAQAPIVNYPYPQQVQQSPAVLMSSPTTSTAATGMAPTSVTGNLDTISSPAVRTELIMGLLEFYKKSDTGSSRLDKLQELRREARERYQNLLQKDDAAEEVAPNAKDVDAIVERVLEQASAETGSGNGNPYLYDYLRPPHSGGWGGYGQPSPAFAPAPIYYQQPVASPMMVPMVPVKVKHFHGW